MAAYSGKLVTWEEALNSDLRLAPDITSFDDAPPVTPDGNGLYEIPLPGRSIAL
jgi:myo-inositol 2-dehydrogenase / D-chiro-inositol 1-dehydrogenase